jgi:hypothetical protein
MQWKYDKNFLLFGCYTILTDVTYIKKRFLRFFQVFKFSTKKPYMGSFFLCEKSVARITKPCKCLHDPELAYLRFNTQSSSLNQDQKSVFKVWQCAQSISRIEKPTIGLFWWKLKNLKIVNLWTPCTNKGLFWCKLKRQIFRKIAKISFFVSSCKLSLQLATFLLHLEFFNRWPAKSCL